jgi:acetyltransferase-like isoleucine patch superfamily enzyme
LVRFSLGFVGFDFANGKGVAFSMVKKLAVPAFAFLLEGCHICTFSAILLQSLATCRRRHGNATSSALYHKSLMNKHLQRETNASAT